MTLRLVAVSFDAPDAVKLGAFWAGMLDRETVAEDGSVLLPGSATQVGLRFVQAATYTGSRNRLHLHVIGQTADAHRHFVENALALGASRQGSKPLRFDRDVYLTDAGGNEFCVIEPGNDYLAGCGPLGEVTCDGSREASLFWRDALGWHIVWDQEGQTAIQSPEGGTKIGWDGWPGSPTTGRTRQRFDLAADNPHEEIERLVGLGATHLRKVADGYVLADPGGDEFVVATTLLARP